MVHLDFRITSCSDEDIKQFVRLLEYIQQIGIAKEKNKICLEVGGNGSSRYNFEFLYGVEEHARSSRLKMLQDFDPEKKIKIKLC